MKKEVFFNFIFTVIVSVLGFVQNKYFVQYMGIETLGMMKLFSQLLAYLNIIELGLGSATAYALYKPLADKDHKNISIVMSTIENIYNKIAILLFILGIFCIPVIPFFLNGANFYNNIYLYWMLYIINTVITYFFIKYVILFTADQKILYVKAVQSISMTVFKLLQIFLIIKYHSFFIFIILLILDNIAQWFCFRKYYKNNYFYIKKTKERFSGIKNDIKNLFWHKMGGLIVFNTDLILISKFTSLETVGIYASYQMILQVLSTVENVFVSIISPKIGNFIAKNSKDKIYEYFRVFDILFCFIATFFVGCTYFFINNFVNLWLGEGMLLDNLTIKLMCINLWIIIFRRNIDIFKEGSGFFSDIKSPLYESGINLIVSLICGKYFGLNGIIVGTIASNFIVISLYRPILVFKECFNKSWKDYLQNLMINSILIISSFIILNYIIIKFNYINLTISSWFMWLIYSIKISILLLGSMMLIFSINNNFRKIFKIKL